MKAFILLVCLFSLTFAHLQRISKHHGHVKDHEDSSHENRCHDVFTPSDCPIGLTGGKYYYDLKNHECLQYEDGKCGPSDTTNSFETLKECIEICGEHHDD